MKRKRVDVNLEELDRVLDQAREVPLSEPDHGKLKSALHALAEMLAKPRTTEKTSAVVEQPAAPPPGESHPPQGHGRHGARACPALRRRLPGLPKRQSISAERTADIGAHRGTSAAGSDRI
jgi:hypothetical protein